MKKMRSFFRQAQRLVLCGGLLASLAMAGCGRADNLVLVSISGLDPSITELFVRMTLDGVPARNQQPTADDPDDSSFSVYKNMQRFGIELPAGTQSLGVNIDGLNTSRVAVKTGSGQLNTLTSKDLDITLR